MAYQRITMTKTVKKRKKKNGKSKGTLKKKR